MFFQHPWIPTLERSYTGVVSCWRGSIGGSTGNRQHQEFGSSARLSEKRTSGRSPPPTANHGTRRNHHAMELTGAANARYVIAPPSGSATGRVARPVSPISSCVHFLGALPPTSAHTVRTRPFTSLRIYPSMVPTTTSSAHLPLALFLSEGEEGVRGRHERSSALADSHKT